MNDHGRAWFHYAMAWVALVPLGGEFVQAAPPPERPASRVQFLSGVNGSGGLVFYGNQRDELQEERYRTGGGVALDFILASSGGRWAVRSAFTLAADLGKSVAQNLPFSPIETAYEIRPYVEWQRGAWLARAGWAHACQHLVYKDHEEPWYTVEGSNLPPDVYYNRLFLGAGSRAIRPEILQETVFNRTGPAPARVLWYLEAGGYVRSLPGMDRESLYDGNDWVGDLTGELRLRLWAGQRWLLFAASRTQVLLDAGDKGYFRERLRLEAVFDSRGFGSTFYAGAHVVDEHPRDSQEGLLELGGVFTF
jgi:hypothetical protein